MTWIAHDMACLASEQKITFRVAVIACFLNQTPHVIHHLALLLRHTNGSTPPPSSLRMLTSNTQSPIMAQPTMSANLLQPLKILTQFAFHAVGQNLRVLAIHNIPLSIEEPCRDFILSWILNDGDNPFKFFRCDFSSPETR